MYSALSDRDYYDRMGGAEPEPDEGGDLDVRCCECGANYLQACEETCGTTADTVSTTSDK